MGMKAITYQEYGESIQLVAGEVPEPKVGPSEVLIRVKAAGVNPIDWKLATGALDGAMPTYFPVIPGWDVAGPPGTRRVHPDSRHTSCCQLTIANHRPVRIACRDRLDLLGPPAGSASCRCGRST